MNGEKMDDQENVNDGDMTPDDSTLEEVREEVIEPRLYKVLLHNDNFTTMEFVTEILITIFHKSPAEATKLMLDVHRKGVGLCGIYPYDIARTKITAVHEKAKSNGFPLLATMEEA